jgi:aryl-alcohol dehydrogenase-like predicted oxidoreductase
MPGEVLDYALSQGVNYVFYSSDMHAISYNRSRAALRKYCRGGSRRRNQVVLAAASYLCDPEKIMPAVIDQMVSLGVDHVDVFHWGWVTRGNQPGTLLAAAHDILRTEEGRRYVDEMTRVTRQARDELRCRGYARFLGISTHDRVLAAELANNPLVDVVMFRYNVAHRGAEHDIFPALPHHRPGTVAFNATHSGAGSLTRRPPGISGAKYAPTHSDLYRFVLDRPEIDLVLTGPRRIDDVRGAFEALDREPLDPRLRDYLCKYGDVSAGRAVVAAAG